MKRDPLHTILRVRQSTLEEAQKAVANAYRVERDASVRAEAASAALDYEMRMATNLAGGDEAVEMFARWLPVGRGTLKQAHDAQREATTSLDQVRAVLTLARAGVRTVETLIEQRHAEQQLENNRREQRTLDETGARSLERNG